MLLSVRAMDKLIRHHMLVDGVPSSSENLRTRTAHDTHETCDIADFIWTAGYLLMATGSVAYADAIEKAMFKAFPKMHY